MTSSASQSATLFASGRKPMNGQSFLTILAAWLAVVLLLGASGIFLGAPGQPPLLLFAAAVLPVTLFGIAVRASQGFREFVLALDFRLIVGMQAWRYAGFGFVALYANHVLPGLFAWPAGLGDMAIGMTAPWMLGRLTQSPAFASSRAFVRWNLLGLLDLFLAISLGAIGGFLLSDRPVTTAPMAALPLVLIPAFLVPSFILMHFAALAQARRRAA